MGDHGIRFFTYEVMVGKFMVGKFTKNTYGTEKSDKE